MELQLFCPRSWSERSSRHEIGSQCILFNSDFCYRLNLYTINQVWLILCEDSCKNEKWPGMKTSDLYMLKLHCSKMVFAIDISSVMLTTPSPLTPSLLDENTTIILEFGIIWAVNQSFLTDLVTSNPLISIQSYR